jgi:hypothetical protein
MPLLLCAFTSILTPEPDAILPRSEYDIKEGKRELRIRETLQIAVRTIAGSRVPCIVMFYAPPSIWIPYNTSPLQPQITTGE